MFKQFYYFSKDDIPFALISAVEAATPEQVECKRAFLLSRLERRWGFNKTKPDRARVMLTQLERTHKELAAAILRRRFNKDKFERYVEKKQIISASLMLQGLRQISTLADVFEEIVKLPPSDEVANLPKFKAKIISEMRSKTSAYKLSGYRVYAAFLVDVALIKKDQSLKSLGYDRNFLDEIPIALKAMDDLIKRMKEQEALIHKLGEEIVTALLGPKASEYLHARRQYELCCTLFTSILTQGPMQYLSIAMSLMTSMSQCFDVR